MPLALNLKLFVKTTIEFLYEIFTLNKVWADTSKEREYDTGNSEDDGDDIKVVDDEEESDKEAETSSDEDNLNDSDLVKKLKHLNEQSESLDGDLQEENISEKQAEFDTDKLNELAAFVSRCKPSAKEKRAESSSDEEGKFSDGDNDTTLEGSEKVLASFVREIHEEKIRDESSMSDE